MTRALVIGGSSSRTVARRKRGRALTLDPFPTILHVVQWRWPAIVTVVVVAGAIFTQAPLRDAATLLPASDVMLSVPVAYILLAPVCNLLDALTLLGTRQHYALLSTLAIVVVAWRPGRALRWQPFRPWRGLGIRCGVLLVAVLAAYAITILIPRPMLALRVTDLELVVVDFHSHTNFSHDAVRGFTVERNRAWHRAGGWNVAYITDHMTLEGAMLGVAANPRRTGDDTILLPGAECRSDGTHFVVLGITEDDRERLRGPEGGGRMVYDARHAVIQTIPATLAEIRARQRTGVGVLVGIELSDGSPHGLDQIQRDRAELLEIAGHQKLNVVAASNTHGWTWTPAAWSLLRIPSWRDLTPAALDLRIQEILRRKEQRAVRIVERYGTDAGPSTLGLAATVPSAAWHTMATLSAAERLSWLAWGWGLAIAGRCLRGGRRRASE